MSEAEKKKQQEEQARKKQEEESKKQNSQNNNKQSSEEQKKKEERIRLKQEQAKKELAEEKQKREETKAIIEKQIQEEKEKKEKRKVKPIDQVIHLLKIKVVSAEINPGSVQLVKRYIDPKNMEDEDRKKRLKKEEEKQMSSFVKIYFGSEPERPSEQKYDINKGKEKLENKKLAQRQDKKYNRLIEEREKQEMILKEEERKHILEKKKEELEKQGKKLTPEEEKKNADGEQKRKKFYEDREQEKKAKIEELQKQIQEEEEKYKNANQNFIQWSKPNEGHLQPAWNEEFQFQRTTENFLTIALFRVDKKEKHHKRYSWLLDKYDDLDNYIGEVKVDFSRFIRKQLSYRKKKSVVLKNDNGEEVAKMQLELEYVDADRPEDPEERKQFNYLYQYVKSDAADQSKKTKRKIVLLQIKADFTKDFDEKLKTFTPYCEIRAAGGLSVKTENADKALQNLVWAQKLEMQIEENINKLYVEVIVKDPVSQFSEPVGVAVINIDKLTLGANQKLKKPVELTIKGGFVGNLNFDYDLVIPEEKKKKKKHIFVDMREILPPNELDQWRESKLQERHELMSQKFYKHTTPKLINDFTPASSIPLSKSFVWTPTKYQKKLAEKDQKYIENRYGEKIQKSLFEAQDPKDAKVQGYILPKLRLKDGSVVEPVHNVIPVTRYVGQNYKNSLFGTGFSRLQSASSLRLSVPYFSVSHSERFPDQDPKKLPPGPTKYGNNVGMMQKVNWMDTKLTKKRKELFQEYRERTKADSPKKDGKQQGGQQQQQQQGQQQQQQQQPPKK